MPIFNRRPYKKPIQNEDDFAADAASLTPKEQQINAGGRLNGVDQKIKTLDDGSNFDQDTPKKSGGLFGGLKKAGKFIGDNADMILPAVFGLSSGVGILPGIMAGYKGRKNREDEKAKLDQENAESQADLDWKQKMLESQNEQKGLDRENRKQIATTPRPSATSSQDEQDWNDLNDLYQTRDSMIADGYTEDEVYKTHPQMKSLITILEQKTKAKKALGADDIQSPLDIPDSE